MTCSKDPRLESNLSCCGKDLTLGHGARTLSGELAEHPAFDNKRLLLIGALKHYKGITALQNNFWDIKVHCLNTGAVLCYNRD